MEYFSGIYWINNGFEAKCNRLITHSYDGCYGLFYLHDGLISLSFDDHKEMTLHAPVAWLALPGVSIKYGVTNPNLFWEKRFITFTGERVLSYIDTGLLPSHYHPPVFRIKQPERFRGCFDELLSYLNSPTMNKDRATYLLDGLFLLLNEQANFKEHPDNISCRIWQLHDSVNLYCEKDWDFEKEAATLNLSYSHFRRLFKEIVGSSPRQFLIKCRLGKAADMLKKSDLSLKEIAAQIGITDVQYFSRIFKKHFFMPPGKFRQEL